MFIVHMLKKLKGFGQESFLNLKDTLDRKKLLLLFKDRMNVVGKNKISNN